jgi:hypothetical protein
MKAGTLITLMLTGWFAFVSAVPGAQAEEWYQGQPGSWHRHGNAWAWKGKHGDEWYEWYEGRRGHWYAERDGGWYWLGDDGREYRRGSHGWEWNGRQHRRP